jgi:hypothetical protein
MTTLRRAAHKALQLRIVLDVCAEYQSPTEITSYKTPPYQEERRVSEGKSAR